MRLRLMVALVAPLLAVCPVFAASAGSAPLQGKAGKVRLLISAPARKIMDRHGASLKDGVLRTRGEAKTYDLATGSGTLRVIPDAAVPEAVAVGLYDRGRRYAALRVEFPRPNWSDRVALTPITDDEAARLFPAKD